MDEANFSAAVGRLRAALAEMKGSSLWTEIVTPRDSVLARFQPIFHRTHIPQLTAEEFRPFLYFEHNHHWTGLYRQVNRVTADMPALRQALLVLTDESRPVATRLDEVGGSIFGMGKGITTAILMVAFPDKYGVWNAVSQDGLVQLELWPTFQRGTSFGSQYMAVNEILLRLASALEIDLWTLDGLFWHLAKEGEMPRGAVSVSEEAPVVRPPLNEPPPLGFGLERHLHQFLFDNWNHTSPWQGMGIVHDTGRSGGWLRIRLCSRTHRSASASQDREEVAGRRIEEGCNVGSSGWAGAQVYGLDPAQPCRGGRGGSRADRCTGSRSPLGVRDRARPQLDGHELRSEFPPCSGGAPVCGPLIQGRDARQLACWGRTHLGKCEA